MESRNSLGRLSFKTASFSAGAIPVSWTNARNKSIHPNHSRARPLNGVKSVWRESSGSSSSPRQYGASWPETYRSIHSSGVVKLFPICSGREHSGTNCQGVVLVVSLSVVKRRSPSGAGRSLVPTALFCWRGVSPSTSAKRCCSTSGGLTA